MNKHIALIPAAGLALLTVVGCATTPGTAGAANHALTNLTTSTSGTNTAATVNTTTSSNHTASTPTTNTTGANSVPSSTASTSDAQTTSTSLDNTSVHTVSTSSAYANEIALIKDKGYDVTGTKPNASVQTNSGDTLSAWIGVAMHSDGHNQYVFFFLNGKYLGTDTAAPSLEITRAQAAGTNAISVTYPVYKSTDSFAAPTGTPVTITYTWSGAKLVPNKAYPKQFSASSDSTNYVSEIALIKGKGYDVTGTKPNASVQTNSGDTLSAWKGVAMHSDGHNQYVFFFLNGKYLGTDTGKPSTEITSAKDSGKGIAVTYAVYKKNDSFANPTGTPVTITYSWSGSKLIANKPYPKQFV